jgi:ferrous iron transport protein A
MPTLADLSPGQSAEVMSVSGDPALVQRLYEMGLLEGERIEVVARALLGDPIEIKFGNSRLSLRKAEAANVTVKVEGGGRKAE